MELEIGKLYRVKARANKRVFAAEYCGKDNGGRLVFKSSRGLTTWHREEALDAVELLN